jgi:hypothetical protein
MGIIRVKYGSDIENGRNAPVTDRPFRAEYGILCSGYTIYSVPNRQTPLHIVGGGGGAGVLK